MRSIRLASLALAGLLATPMATVAQQPAVQLALQAERSVVDLGEPVYVTARVINGGSRPIAFRQLLDPRDGYLKISVRDAAGEGVGYMPLAVRDSDEGARTLAPGAQSARTVPIFFGATGWVFKGPGKYSVRASFNLQGAEGVRLELTSPAITIEVREGRAGVRDLVGGSEASLQAGRFLEWRAGDQLAEGRALLERLATESPESPLASHYRLASARSWVRPFKDYRVGRVRPADPARALSELERVRDDHLPAGVLVEKRFAQVTALLAVNRGKDAAQALAGIRSVLDERSELADFRSQFTGLESAVRQAPPPR
jgi:hypothetical protein